MTPFLKKTHCMSKEIYAITKFCIVYTTKFYAPQWYFKPKEASNSLHPTSTPSQMPPTPPVPLNNGSTITHQCKNPRFCSKWHVLIGFFQKKGEPLNSTCYFIACYVISTSLFFLLQVSSDSCAEFFASCGYM